jgi:hypothetical protein
LCLPCMWYQNCKHNVSFAFNQPLIILALSPAFRSDASMNMYIPIKLRDTFFIAVSLIVLKPLRWKIGFAYILWSDRRLQPWTRNLVYQVKSHPIIPTHHITRVIAYCKIAHFAHDHMLKTYRTLLRYTNAYVAP